MLFDSIVDYAPQLVLAVSLLAGAIIFFVLQSDRGATTFTNLTGAVVCGLVVSVGASLITRQLGLDAPAVAASMPSAHPGLIEYQQARADRDVLKLVAFRDRYILPVGAKDLLVLAAAVDGVTLAPSTSAEFATGYVSRVRFREIAREVLALRGVNDPKSAMLAASLN